MLPIVNYQNIRTNSKQFLSITSLSVTKFDELLPHFDQAWQAHITQFTLDGLPRVRPFEGIKDPFGSSAQKLFFILAYQKNASLQEFFAAAFELNQSNCNKWIHLLSPILDKSLEAYCPKRNIEEVNFIEGEIYLTDATERPVQRDTYEQKNFFSGKKKRHTIKNIAFCSVLGTLLFLSPTFCGKIHDKKLVETYEITPKHISIYADLGFIGWKMEDIEIVLPHKKHQNTKTEKRKLTQTQIDYNKAHAKTRVKIENLFAHLKVMRILKDTMRNYKQGFKDLVIQTAAALYNFRKGFKI